MRETFRVYIDSEETPDPLTDVTIYATLTPRPSTRGPVIELTVENGGIEMGTVAHEFTLVIEKETPPILHVGTYDLEIVLYRPGDVVQILVVGTLLVHRGAKTS